MDVGRRIATGQSQNQRSDSFLRTESHRPEGTSCRHSLSYVSCQSPNRYPSPYAAAMYIAKSNPFPAHGSVSLVSTGIPPHARGLRVEALTWPVAACVASEAPPLWRGEQVTAYSEQSANKLRMRRIEQIHADF